jgi:hypothetical protein
MYGESKKLIQPFGCYTLIRKKPFASEENIRMNLVEVHLKYYNHCSKQNFYDHIRIS